MGSSLSKHGILSTSGIINPNIMPNSYNMPYGSANPATGTWRNAGSSTMTKARVLIQNDMYGFQNVGIQTPNDASCYGIDNFPLLDNTEYVISMYARIVAGTEGYAGYNIYYSDDISGSHTKIDKNYRVTPLTKDWTRCWLHFKTHGGRSDKRNIYIGITTGETEVTTQMCLIKIEQGSILTPWCPNTGDDLYVGNTLGFNEFITQPIGSIAETHINANQFYEL